MPELPEVETIRQDLRAKIIGLKIKNIEVRNQKSVRGETDVFCSVLKGNSIKEIDRIGKLLIFQLAKSGQYMLTHLKMTGQLIYSFRGGRVAGGHSLDKGDGLESSKHTHVIISFSDGSQLQFNDMRKFGYLQLVNSKELEKIKAGYGIEPGKENFSLADLKKVFANRKTNIKAVLLNQKLISGIGNIYADEILFAAKVKPTRIANSLSETEIKKIHKASLEIIKKAIKNRGTTFSNYRDADGQKGNFSRFLQVYERAGLKCLRCSGIIKKIKLAGRGTHFCDCQE